MYIGCRPEGTVSRTPSWSLYGRTLSGMLHSFSSRSYFSLWDPGMKALRVVRSLTPVFHCV